MNITRLAPLFTLLGIVGTVACDPATPGPALNQPSSAQNDPSAMPGPDSSAPPASPSTTPEPEASTSETPPDADPVAAAGDAAPAVAASNAFAFSLFHELIADSGNIVFSPASISVAVAMTYAGARGDTAKEMQAAMHFPKEGDALHGGWATVLHDWQSVKTAEIAVADRIYGDRGYTFEAPFKQLSQDRYGAPLLAVDFAGAPEAQRGVINGWVAKQTKNRIRDLIPAGGVTSDTRMALVNAIYFKAKWEDPFQKNQTATAAFAGANGSVDVPMMSQTEAMPYAEMDGVKVVERRYEHNDFSAVFVLPDKADGLAALEKKLDAKLLEKWTSALKFERVWMKMPRFELAPKSPLELSAMLGKLGMKTAFVRGKADFTGITNPKSAADQLFIEKVYHKAYVGMDEAGTEAAAATAVMMGRAGGMPAEPKAFHADRPFLFFIRDVKTGLVMFAGRVANPSK